MNTLLIGAGNIAGAKPMAKKDGPIVTHIQAILADERFDLIGIVDKDIEMAQRLCDKWLLFDYKNDVIMATDVGLLSGAGVELVVVATPAHTHLAVVKEVFEHLNPRAILLEKPGGSSLEEALAIHALCVENNCKLYVNYQRNFAFDFKEIYWFTGKIESARCDYVRGLHNDASHAIALFQKLFGDVHVLDAKPIVHSRVIDDLPGDPTLTACYSLPRCKDIMLHGHDGRNYDMFELTFFGVKGILRFTNHAEECLFYGVKPEEVYGSYNTVAQPIKVNIAKFSMQDAYNAIALGQDCPVDYINVWSTMQQIKNAYFNKRME